MSSKLVSFAGLLIIPAILGISINFGRLRHVVSRADAAVESTSAAPTAVDPFLECPECDHTYAPYCAEDGLIYQNLCVLQCQGALPLREGLCDPCECQYYTDPVCTREGSLFANRCEAECRNAKVFAAGAACADLEHSPTVGLTPAALTESITIEFIAEDTTTEVKESETSSPEICTDDYVPVCGSDGQTYSNECYADFYQAKVIVDDECSGSLKNPSTCSCSDDFAPVCAFGGKTFRNVCYARCARVPIVHKAACSHTRQPERPVCACPAVYDPVCGVNGRTYSNSCSARCASVEVAYKGQCGLQTSFAI